MCIRDRFHQVTLARREALLLQWHRREKAALRAIETERRRARRNRNQQWKKVQLTEQAEHFPTLAEKIDGLTSEMAEHQRTVAEAFLGSTFSAAQGPPGTGKTRLIIDLVAAELVKRVQVLADTTRTTAHIAKTSPASFYHNIGAIVCKMCARAESARRAEF